MSEPAGPSDASSADPDPAAPGKASAPAEPALSGRTVDDVPAPATASSGAILRGATVSPGLVLGRVHRKDYDLDRARAERVPLDAVERELNRFTLALEDSRAQLADLKRRLEGRIKADDARILDTHIAYLKDSVFIADVENLILGEQMRLEAAITKVIGDFDRIFRLVQSQTLRQSAVDLRDVGIRVLRNLESHAAKGGGGAPPPEQYVLIARELSIVDMFNLANERVQGIVTEEGSMTSHAAIFARSMRIPTLTGVQGLLSTVDEGDFVILDATEGLLRVRPDDLVRQQYAGAASEEKAPASDSIPDWAEGPVRTHDAVTVDVAAVCGNLPEVEQASELGLREVGLYRTELLYLVDREPPSRDALVHHYSGVIAAARGGRVTFRLLNADASLELPYLHPSPEANPHLGRAGVRALLANERVLRRQVRAILIAGAGAEARIAVPFVTDCGELRRLAEILFEERFELKKGGEGHLERSELGAVVETPAALLGLRDLAREADFLTINLDSLIQYVLAADRENSELADHFETLHPVIVRALAKAVTVAREQGTELSVFGVTAVKPAILPLLLGIGIRRLFAVPAELRAVRRAIEAVDLESAAAAARRAAAGACAADAQSLVVGYHHGYAPS